MSALLASPAYAESQGKPAVLASTGLGGGHGEARRQNTGGVANTRASDKLVLTLSLTLSTPEAARARAHAPGTPATGASKGSAESGQQDAIAKAQKLQALNDQIAELERTIKAQQIELDTPNRPAAVSPSAPAPGAPVQNPAGEALGAVGVSGVASAPGAAQPEVDARVPAIKPTRNAVPGMLEWVEGAWLELSIGLAVSLLVILGFVRYRKTRSQDVRSQDENEASRKRGPPAQPSMVKTPQGTQMSQIESTIKVPAYSAEAQSKSILPPEYEMLEEADIYLRFGHDKLAEEALREAIKINPKNPQAYLTLLRIYSSHEDSAAFLAVAQQLKALGDPSVWARVVEMGHTLDPDNALYRG